MISSLPIKRYRNTLDFLNKVLPTPAIILDLGVRNPFTELMERKGYTVYNTIGEDLDLEYQSLSKYKIDAIVAFEILEHLVNPFTLLKNIQASKLICTVPLNLWFAKAYRSKTDMRDRHFHEFEDWQFDWLLQKAGWEIKSTQKWTSPINKIGFRPILRTFTPRYYAVYAEKKDVCE